MIELPSPAEAGHAHSAAARAYLLASGGTHVNGPGYGNYDQSGILNADAGDIIAMKLVNLTTGFAHANETVAPSAVSGTTG